MIQFGLAFIGRASPEPEKTLLARSDSISLRGIIMLAVTNRIGMRARSAGSIALLTLAVWAGLNLVGNSARALGDDKPQSELLKPLQGSWATDGEGLEAKWTFDGEKVKATVNGTDYECSAKVDTEAKPFATIDLEIKDGPEDAKGKVSKGIYKLDGEKLTICVSAPGKDRPKEFTQVEDESYLFAMKKQK
jgi:uncharacterized protein (TIGR03067 family)